MSLAVRLFLIADAVVRKAGAAAQVVHQGLWLGLMGRRALTDLTTAQYERWTHYQDPERNREGLYSWEETVVERHFRDTRSFLVASAGGGREMIALASRGVRVDGFDCSRELVASGRELLRSLGIDAELLLADPGEVPDEIGTYDGVWIGGGYLHIVGTERRQRFLRRLADRLAVGGQLLVPFPRRSPEARRYRYIRTLGNLIRRLRLSRERLETGDVLDRTFDHHFTAEEIARELEGAGLEIVEVSSGVFPHAVGRRPARAGDPA